MEEKQPTVKDFMQIKVISVKPETPVVSAVRLLYANNLKGLPVIDNEQKVVGIFTEYDLIAKSSSINLSVFLKLVLAF
ncbi:MAG TPA: CBS domain-containing protein, partial [Patescibacteria group bacterium]|nr:CBS domain-containing protein [Patescibacteria group bacterium]